MSDITPLNDPELNRLEQRLASVKLEPTAQRRERLLYSCGYAAGLGRVKWRVRAMSAATVLLAFVCSGLSYLLLTHTTSDTTEWKPLERPIAGVQSSDSQNGLFDAQPQKLENDRSRQLRAGSSFNELLTMEKLRKSEPSIAFSPESSPKRVLTAAGPTWLDDL